MVSYIPLFLLLALRSVADTIQPTDITPESAVDHFVLEWFPNDASNMMFNVDPLTSGAGIGQSPTEIAAYLANGTLVIPTDSGNSTQSSQIAFLTCDPDNNSNLGPGEIFTFVADKKPQAIVLYSTEADGCNLTETSDYSAVFTMTSTMNSMTILGMLNTSSTPSMAKIATRTVLSNNGTAGSPPAGGSSSSSNDNNDGATPAPTTAVAMSILYSITGIITLLFLIIIATGAVRAHRHPERYGPRNGFPGRPRQSRAKGLARAMLETLPIVKFGDPEPDKPARDVELEGGNTPTSNNNEAAVAAGGREDGETPRDVSAAEQEGGLGPNQAPPADKSEVRSGDGDLGCSICTEDFTRGEDVRVLPCNHKYHPACIDPWLLNVSGTCPLCRVDLRPVQSNSSQLPTVEDFEEPTVVTEATEADTAGLENSTGPSNTRRRMSRLLDFNRLRHAAPEERIAALRRLRTQDQSPNETATATPENGDAAQAQAETGSNGSETGNGATTSTSESREERSRRSRFTRTIRAAFDIRTVSSPAERAVPPVGDASMVGGRGA